MSPNTDKEEIVGVNKQIHDVVLSDRNILHSYGLQARDTRYDIEGFLAETSFENRRKRAILISNKALERHGKGKSLHPFLSRLAEIETGVQQYHPTFRDHTTHSVYVFLLGLLFISKLDLPEIDPLSWKIASLLHDIGYPLQLFSFSINRYLSLVHEYKLEVLNQPSGTHISSSIAIKGLEKLKFSEVDAFALIERRLEVWGFHLNLRNINQHNQNQGRMNHGILSALIVTNIIDSLYEQKNPEREVAKTVDNIDWGTLCFNRQIVDAVSAISLHDLMDEIEEVPLQSCSIAYLLILCDRLQEWDRYSPGQRVYDPFSVSVRFNGNQATCRLDLPESKVHKIQGVRNKLHSETIDLRILPSNREDFANG